MNIAKALGFTESSKLLMIHADDTGLAHSENQATMQLLKNGGDNSYSIMVPCPWFHEMALFAKENPQFDYGIHLTLTCEWEIYRFGPVLPVSEVPSLVDKHGHFHRKRAEVKSKALLEEVRKEWVAQMEKALAFGLTPTHIDSHMYTVALRPELFELYQQLGDQYGLPVFIDHVLMEGTGLNPQQHVNSGQIRFDDIYMGRFQYFEAGELGDFYRDVLDTMQSGLNMILIHPAFDDREMQGVTINHPNFGAAWRQIDFDVFSSEEIKQKIKANAIQLVTWKELHQAKQKST